MDTGNFEIAVKAPAVAEMVRDISGLEPLALFQICEKYGVRQEDVRRYDTYRVVLPGGEFILKKTGEAEADNYTRYLAGRGFHVPDYVGRAASKDGAYLLISCIEGEDLRDMTDEKALAAAGTLAAYQNAFWVSGEGRDFPRYRRYMERIQRRWTSVRDNKLLSDAYALFLARQETCPLTLSNGDLLQFNLIWHHNAAYVIDWGFGGIMPYSLDIARFIAHATEGRDTFPFYMTDGQKALFVDEVYRLLANKPPYDQYLSDIKLALLNEYVEFVEAGEDEDGWYLEHASRLAAALLEDTEKK